MEEGDREKEKKQIKEWHTQNSLLAASRLGIRYTESHNKGIERLSRCEFNIIPCRTKNERIPDFGLRGPTRAHRRGVYHWFSRKTPQRPQDLGSSIRSGSKRNCQWNGNEPVSSFTARSAQNIGMLLNFIMPDQSC